MLKKFATMILAAGTSAGVMYAGLIIYSGDEFGLNSYLILLTANLLPLCLEKLWDMVPGTDDFQSEYRDNYAAMVDMDKRLIDEIKTLNHRLDLLEEKENDDEKTD